MAKILVIDDSAAHRAEIRAALEGAGDFEILEASDGLGGLRRLLSEAADLVLCDLELPGLVGEKLLQLKGCRGDGAPIPFLFVTASQDRARRTRLLENGASDVVTKPFHAPDLIARLRLHLQIRQLQEELLVKNARLECLSTTDELTGLRTRRYLNEALDLEFQRAVRHGHGLAVLMADLDHFKGVNDRYGHQAGDAVLRETAARLLRRLRASDVAGRYGGEEFLVLLSHSDAKGAATAAEHWCSAVGEAPFALPEGRELRVTISIGVAAYRPGMRSAEDLIGVADAALYRAKANGRNRVEIAAE